MSLHVVIPDITGTDRKCPQAPKVRVIQDVARLVILAVTGTARKVFKHRSSSELRLGSYVAGQPDNRQPSLECAGEVNLCRLAKEAMRMRPSRIMRSLLADL
jgi:hypothetical protein